MSKHLRNLVASNMAWRQFPSTSYEKNIWVNWNLQWNQKQAHQGKNYPPGVTPHKWTPPPPHMIQLNFDRACKDNRGKAGYGGIFWNHKGNVLLTFLGSVGRDTNNSAELEGLWQGLLLAELHGYSPLIIEGDSHILINMVNNILQGTPSHRVRSNWRLAKRLEHIEKWLLPHRAVTIKHIRHTRNKVSDFLANIGVDSGKTLCVGTLNTISTTPQLQDYNDLVQNERVNEEESYSDVGVNPRS